MCCAYLEKHLNLYGQFYSSPVELWKALQLQGSQMSASMTSLLQWLQFDVKQNISINTLKDWTDLTRRVCYFNCNGQTDLFKLILPSDAALKLHALRGEYIMQLVMESCIPSSQTYCCINDGWTVDGDTVAMKWEENVAEIKKSLSFKKKPLKRRCQCQSKGCIQVNPGKSCKNCWQACQPCTEKCHCKGNCNNPHNNDGLCEKCSRPSSLAMDPPATALPSAPPTITTDSEDSEEEYDLETLSNVVIGTVYTETDSEDSEEEFQGTCANNITDAEECFHGDSDEGLFYLPSASHLTLTDLEYDDIV
jgi:hypothetical protein